MKNGGGKLCGKHKNEQTMKTFRKIKEISEIKQNKRKKNTQTTNDKKQIRATSSTKIKKKQFSNAKLNKNKTISHYDLAFFCRNVCLRGRGTGEVKREMLSLLLAHSMLHSLRF